ncbi:MAG TPA: hypothetical protein VIY86_12910, partial [Pirellulaceae bacterium]
MSPQYLHRFLILGLTAALLSNATRASAQTWTGAAGDGLWANPVNWTGGVPNFSGAAVTLPTAGNYANPIDLGPSTFGNQIDLRDMTFNNLPGDATLINTIPGGVLRIYGNFSGGGAGTGVMTLGSAQRTVTIHNDILFMNSGVLLNNDSNGAAQVYHGTIRTNVHGGAIILTGRSNALNPAITMNGQIRDGLSGQITRLETGYTPDGANHRAVARVTNDANDFSGWTWVKTNTLQFTSVGNVGSPSALGVGGTGSDAILWLGDTTYAGTLDYVGTAPLGHATNRSIHLYGTSGGGTVLANGAG